MQNSGEGNFGELVTLRIWWGKTLANCNELSLSCSIKTCHLHAMLSLKTTIVYCIIMCGTKIVHAFGNTTNMKMFGDLHVRCSYCCRQHSNGPLGPASASQDGSSSRSRLTSNMFLPSEFFLIIVIYLKFNDINLGG